MPVAFSSEDGILKAGGHRLYLKGVNWSGFEVKSPYCRIPTARNLFVPMSRYLLSARQHLKFIAL
jgi:hypothetical protein